MGDYTNDKDKHESVDPLESMYDVPPEEVSVDGVRAKMPSIDDRIKWEQFMQARKGKRPGRVGPFVFSKIRSPGTAGR